MTDRRLSTDVKRAGRWLAPNVVLVVKWAAIGFAIGLWWFVKWSLKVGLVLSVMLLAIIGQSFKPIQPQKHTGSSDD